MDDKFNIKSWNKDKSKITEYDDNSYSIEIDSSDIDIVGEKNIVGIDNFDSTSSTFTVKFDIDIEHRSWGIKSIIVSPRKVSGSVFISIWGEGDEPDKESEIVCDDFELESDITINSDVITITHLEVDVFNKKILCT